jgi:hypothetical protein
VSATALQIVGASVLGALLGQLTAGIPLAMRLNRHERPRRRPPADDIGTVIIDEWPDDRAAAMLAAWRAERGRRPVLRATRDARSGAVSRGVMPRPTVQRGITEETPRVRLVTN